MAKFVTKIILFSVLTLMPVSAFAASLFFSDTAEYYSVGQTFSISVYVESTDQSMNAASGAVSFPADKLEVVSLSKNGSILTLWVQEPSFSNSTGKVNFEGIAFNPGFIGAKGKIMTITFKAKTAGNAVISFSSGSILANDGVGTEILGALKTETINITGSAAIKATATAASTKLMIRSSTHPDEDGWYSNSDPEFSWDLNSDILEIKTLIGSLPNGAPTVRYAPPISSKKVEDLKDGTHYFSIQSRTASGWGSVSRYKVNIDTEAPKSFEISIDDSVSNIFFNTSDDLSGISHYEIKIDDYDYKRIADPTYNISSLSPGSHSVTVAAFDKAGNSIDAFINFNVEGTLPPITPEIEKRTTFLIDTSLWINMILSLVALFGLYKSLKLALINRRLKREKRAAEIVTQNSFTILRNDVEVHINRIKEKSLSWKLTKNEIMFLEDLEASLKTAEKVISKEIKDIHL